MKLSGSFVNATEARELAPGSVVFEEGEVGQEMFGIVSGAVRLTSGGREVALLGPDDTFGEMAIVDGSPRMATATATEASVLAVIDRRQFLFLVHETPTFALQVMASMAPAPPPQLGLTPLPGAQRTWALSAGAAQRGCPGARERAGRRSRPTACPRPG